MNKINAKNFDEDGNLLENDYYERFYNKDKSDLDLEYAIKLLDDYHELEVEFYIDKLREACFLLNLVKEEINEDLELFHLSRLHQVDKEILFMESRLFKLLPNYVEICEEFKSNYNIDFNIGELIKDHKLFSLARDYCTFERNKNMVF